MTSEGFSYHGVGCVVTSWK